MKKNFSWKFLLLGFVVASYYLASDFPLFFTEIYNQKIYSILDRFMHVFSKIPFSVGDVLYAFVVVFIIYKIVIGLKKKAYQQLVLFLSTCFLLFLAIFQLFWGFNNYKYGVAHQLKLERNYTKPDLDTLTKKLIKLVNNQQIALTNDVSKKVVIAKKLEVFNETAALNYSKLPDHLQKLLIKNAINPVKPSFYSYALSYTGFSGYFNPFTHENHVNIEIPSIGMPVTVAHEMAHQLGVSSEAEANFFGFQVMQLSSNETFKYAANLYALKYCLKEFRYENEETYLLLFDQLNKGVQENILESELFWSNKRNVSTYFFKYLYGGFLKMNNQKDGIKSYNKFVDLLINYDKKFHQF
ncbi:DUF3810 domain-containing protein [Flavobacterium sp. CBA20B-1]|uniref:DUF3810 domain-containing protein n=1 Tax=unclassified Flavobacterium TaxID=196869 RepID=UPI0022240D52|nr:MULTISPECIES: DUF3810 domain-containing protein [unclassified Flavobacterium]WCM42604.1 DUF3810 domain-containing protein [Flavobacterium sp. CBA20B-1]